VQITLFSEGSGHSGLLLHTNLPVISAKVTTDNPQSLCMHTDTTSVSYCFVLAPLYTSQSISQVTQVLQRQTQQHMPCCSALLSTLQYCAGHCP
jgi:hypothetical protein